MAGVVDTESIKLLEGTAGADVDFYCDVESLLDMIEHRGKILH